MATGGEDYKDSSTALPSSSDAQSVYLRQNLAQMRMNPSVPVVGPPPSLVDLDSVDVQLGGGTADDVERTSALISVATADVEASQDARSQVEADAEMARRLQDEADAGQLVFRHSMLLETNGLLCRFLYLGAP